MNQKQNVRKTKQSKIFEKMYQNKFRQENFCLAHFVNASITRTHDDTTFQRHKLLNTITALASNGAPRKMARQMLHKGLLGEQLFLIPKISTFFGRLSRHHADADADHGAQRQRTDGGKRHIAIL
jgi:hypothetical protein